MSADDPRVELIAPHVVAWQQTSLPWDHVAYSTRAGKLKTARWLIEKLDEFNQPVEDSR